MSKTIENSLFMLSPFTLQQAGFYQDLLRGISNYQQLGSRLIYLAERAHTFRQFDRLQEIAQILARLPIKSYQAIGYYYLAVSCTCCGTGNLEKAKKFSAIAVDAAPSYYKAKAILSLAAVAAYKRDYESELSYYIETLKASKDVATSLNAYRGIAIYKAREGSHRQALSDLEQVLPWARLAPSHIYLDYLNSLAVELGEVNHKDEARNIMQVVLTSPFARVYPEWRETAEDLRPSRRSFVNVSAPHYNVLALPERESQTSVQPKPARVLNFAKWKKKMDKKAKDKQTEKLLDEMSLQDMGFKLLELITSNQADEYQMRVILTFVMNLFSEPVKPPDKPSA